MLNKNKKDIIKKILPYGIDDLRAINYNDYINIAYGIDENFVPPMGISMTSIVVKNIKCKFIFHIFMDNINEVSKIKLKMFASKYKIIVIIYLIDIKLFAGLTYTEHFSLATYNRFIVPIILKNIVQKVIYIDADVQCFGDLSKLLKLDFNNNIVAVVNDIRVVRKRQSKYLKLKNNSYFNAGFMYIDINKWNENNVSEKTLEVAQDNIGNFNWQDQDALNVVLDGNCKYIDKKYDYLLDMRKKDVYIPDDVIFVHYVGRYKPWTEWCLNPEKEKFLAVMENSLWKDMSIKKINNYKQMKQMGYSCYIYKKYRKAIYWYLKYSFCKLIFNFSKAK